GYLASMPLLSVVAPMYEEREIVRPFVARVAAALKRVDYELIVVDDGSKDGTGSELAALAAADERLKVIALSRNFGHQAALTAGPAVPFAREPRPAGETKYTLGKMLRFSFDAITSFSYAPLQWATILGFTCSALAFLGIPLTIVARYTNIYSRGVPSVILVVLLLGGIQLICI